METPEGFKPFNSIKEGCLSLQGFYPSEDSKERRFIVKATCKGEMVREENVTWGPQSIYGPDVDDFLKLEKVTQEIIAEVECKCSG